MILVLKPLLYVTSIYDFLRCCLLLDFYKDNFTMILCGTWLIRTKDIKFKEKVLTNFY